jgi:hypothetical protein
MLKHELYEVTIEWHDTLDNEETYISVGDGIDPSIDEECVFSFTSPEWTKVKSEVLKHGRSNNGDFSIIKIHN